MDSITKAAMRHIPINIAAIMNFEDFKIFPILVICQLDSLFNT